MRNRNFQRSALRLAGVALIPLLGLFASSAAFAAGDAQRGKQLSVPCQACHGPTGNSENAAFPKLAGQHYTYLLHSLTAYTNGDRKNAIMQGMAAPLSKQDRADLAAWYASQEGLDTLRGQR